MNEIKRTYHINDADELVNTHQFLLDVREDFEYELGHIQNAMRISVNELHDRLNEVPKDRRIHVYCQHGKRGEKAVDLLIKNGFDAVNLEGGYAAYTGMDSVTEITPTTIVKASEIDPNRVKVQASGLQCPGPLLKVNEVMKQLTPGQQLEMTVTDFGFCTDIEAWAKKTGHTVVKNEKLPDRVIVVLQKNEPLPLKSTTGHEMVQTNDGATMVVFSGDLDKVLASFIIATGARSMGKDVTMFFTFWGLNAIKDPSAKRKKKTGLDKMFQLMMPKSAEKLPISNMNMFGLGSKMIQYVMKKKRVDPLTEMIHKAEQLGVKFVACTMSMDIMAISKEELLPSVDIGGVGTYLGDAEHSNLNLFI